MLNLKNFKKVSFDNRTIGNFLGGKAKVVGTTEAFGNTLVDVDFGDGEDPVCGISDAVWESYQ